MFLSTETVEHLFRVSPTIRQGVFVPLVVIIPVERPSLEASIFPLLFQVVREPISFAYF